MTKKILNFNTFVTLCSVIGIAGVFMIRGADPVHSVRRDGVAMDTVISVQVSAAKSSAALNEILDGAFSLIGEADGKFSMHRPDSEISAINERSGKSPVNVSAETYAVMTVARHAAELTGGAFDPTMGAVTSLWREKLGAGEIPADGEIAAAMLRVGYDRVATSAPGSVFLRSEGVIDLGGIAKGFVSAMLRDYLRREGVTSALIDLGGNIVVMGGRRQRGESERATWNIGIQRPDNPRGTPICTLKISEGSVITAGVYERFWDVGGRRYTHIFDPATGRPVEGPLKSVTIVSDDPALGDALSTAFMVMGEPRSLALLSVIPGADAIFISDDGNGGYRITATSGLMESLAPSPGASVNFHDVE